MDPNYENKVIILTDFKTGIGDFYVTTMEVIYLSNKLRELRFIPLLYLNASYDNKYIGNIKFDEIYNGGGFEAFESIHDVNVCSLNLSEFEGFSLKKKGDHFLVFSYHDLPQIIIPCFNAYEGNRINFPYTLPLFVDEVYKREKEFLKNKPEFDFIQFRTRNAINGLSYPMLGEMNFKESHDCTRVVTQRVYEVVAKSTKQFYIGSNDQFFIDKMKELPNVFYYTFKNIDLFTNDYDYYKVKRDEVSRDIYLDRLYDNLAEFTSLSKAQNYYIFASMRWISNFISYGLSHNKNNFTLYQISEDGNSGIKET